MLACALAGLWIRSVDTLDGVSFDLGSRGHAIASMHHGMIWYGWDNSAVLVNWRIRSQHVDETDFRDKSLSVIARDWTVYHRLENPEANTRVWSVPYWRIVVPLTLISASLILWKRRPIAS